MVDLAQLITALSSEGQAAAIIGLAALACVIAWKVL